MRETPPPAEPRPAIKRLGKTREHVVDVLEAAGGSLEVGALAAEMGYGRARDLLARVLPPLVEARMVEVSEAGDTVSLVADWLEHLNEERELAGEIEAYRADLRRYARERAAYREHLGAADAMWTPCPQRSDIVSTSEWNAGADGEISELERVEPPDEDERTGGQVLLPFGDLGRLYELVGSTVLTDEGPGQLWQVFSDRVGVVLEESPKQVTFLPPAAILEGEVAA